MKLFLDNNLPPRVARALNELVEPDGHQVVHLRDMFSHSTPDVTWLSELGSQGGWTILSADMRIHKNKAEREAWRRSNTIAFFMTRSWSRLKFTEKAAKILLRWSDLETQTKLVAAPAAFEIGLSGKMKQLKG